MSIDLAWAAGLFDGEGCIGIYRAARGHFVLQVRMVMGHQEAIVRFQGIVGSGTVRARPARGVRKPCWCWTCASADRYRVLEQLRPYLVVKVGEAEIAQAFLSTGLACARGELHDAARAAKSKPGNRRQ